MPAQFPLSGRYRAYTLFDATGLIYLLVGFLVLRAVWALGSGEAAWQNVLDGYRNPISVLFHLLALVCVVFVGVRFFRLFPKAQPPRMGRVKTPPQPLILGALYTAWAVVTVVFAAILTGGIF
jgi:fumarate reductase subunit C